MSLRPDHIELPPNPKSFDSQQGSGSPRSNSNIPSPRSGDVPPALSPLDAFALQGRLLAAKFEEEDGRRISRLAPLTVANGFANRPTYFSRPFHTVDNQTNTQLPHKPEPSGNAPEFSRPKNKHHSFYPSIQADEHPSATFEAPPQEKPALAPVFEERSPDLSAQEFEPRNASPESIQHELISTDTAKIDFAPAPMRKAPTNESLKSNSSLNQGLAPPQRSPMAPPRSPRGYQPSIRSVRMDSGDDSDAMSFQSDPYDLSVYQRKASVKSTRDRPHSPFSPTLAGRRSPSISSEISNGELQGPPRRSMNFSRPLSPANNRMPHRPSIDSRPSFDQSTRMLTVGSPPVRPSMDVVSINDSENLESPPQLWTDDNGSVRLTDDEQPSGPSSVPPASYTYTSYALPRGRKVVSNGSFKAQSWLAHQFEWDHPTLDNPHRTGVSAQEPTHAHTYEPEPDNSLERQPTLPSIIDDEPSPGPEPSRTAMHKPQASYSDFIDKIPPEPLEPDRPVVIRSRSCDEGLSRPIGQSRFHEEGIAEPLPRPKSQKSTSNLRKAPTHHAANNEASKDEVATPTLHRKSEDKPRKSSEKKRHKDHGKDTAFPTPDQVPAEEHLAKGIELHENGNVQKATYHLRIAARAGLPSAMLLYALACRHGWGMRPNQQEAVLWLRKAVDISRLEVDSADANHLLPPSFGGAQDKAAQKQHKAQLALSIYELGVSYLNGWGIQLDKTLALKCFEIAAGWGDADALAEAGFCYAQGVGCKKNLAKAAGYYRRAEQQGISMAGNSWIYKDKYNPKDAADDERGRGHGKDDDKKKKPRDKSRTRTFFGGKKKGAE